MPLFVYKAVDKNGQIVRNKVEEQSKKAVVDKLKRNNFYPISIIQLKKNVKNTKAKKRNVSNTDEILKIVNASRLNKTKEKSQKEKFKELVKKSEKITRRDLVIFTQNFLLLKKANFNNIHALSTIIEGTENYTLKEVLYDMLAGLEAGENMFVTMEYYSEVFPFIYTNMIKVGEMSGSLTNSLAQAVKYLDDTADINKKLKKILIPNIIQFVALFFLLIAGTAFAIPQIQKVFDQVGSKETLPKVTVWFSGVVDNLILYWYIPVIIIIIIIIAIIAYVRTPKGRYQFNYFKYTVPIFGELIYAIDFSRLLRATLLNIQNGMRIQEALEVSKNVSNNIVMLSMIETGINNVLIGQSWIEPFEKSGLSSPMVTEMLKIGMQTDLAEMMEKILEYMDLDINNIMEKIVAVLPQVVYSIVGIVLIFFVIVVLVPIINLYMGTFLFSAAGL